MISVTDLMDLTKMRWVHAQGFGTVSYQSKGHNSLNTIMHIWSISHLSHFLITFTSFQVLSQDTDGKLSRVSHIKLNKYILTRSKRQKDTRHILSKSRILNMRVWWNDILRLRWLNRMNWIFPLKTLTCI